MRRNIPFWKEKLQIRGDHLFKRDKTRPVSQRNPTISIRRHFKPHEPFVPPRFSEADREVDAKPADKWERMFSVNRKRSQNRQDRPFEVCREICFVVLVKIIPDEDTDAGLNQCRL